MNPQIFTIFMYACIAALAAAFALFFKAWMDGMKEELKASNAERVTSSNALLATIKELSGHLTKMQRGQDNHGFRIGALETGLKEVQTQVVENLGRRHTDTCPQEDCPLLRQQRLDGARVTHPGGRIIPLEG